MEWMPIEGGFDRSFHANNNPAATRSETRNPCAICGWGPHMAIHGAGKFLGKHEYVPTPPPVHQEEEK